MKKTKLLVIFTFILSIMMTNLIIINAQGEPAGIVFDIEIEEPRVEKITYVKFLELAENKEVKEVRLNPNSNIFELKTKYGETFYTDNPKTENFREFLLLNEIDIKDTTEIINEQLYTSPKPKKVEHKSNGSGFFTMITISFVCIFIARYFHNRNQRRMIKSTQVNSNDCDDETPTITFDDLQGCNEVKKDMQFVVDFLKNPKRYHEMGARMPKGIVLYGPPGTGKTLTAKAIAGTAGVPFISASGSDFVEMYVGVGARRVRDLYREARQKAPCIVFIDEIDAVGKKRGSSSNDERDQTINALLTELDGFDGSEAVLTICATNRLELLDDALIRPGRFDKHIAVPLPEKEDRLEILKLHARNKKLSEEVNLNKIAEMTMGFSGADLEALLNESAFIAVNEDKDFITLDDVDRAFFRLVMKGDKKENLTRRDKEELELVAWHEAGHALATKLLTDDEVPKVTIIPSTSGAGGVTFRTPKKANLQTKRYIKNLIQIMYAGRVAEYMLLGDEEEITTGASNDIKQATSLIKEYINTYGMSDKYGMINRSVLDEYGSKEDLVREASNISKVLYENTVKILEDNKELLEEIAKQLIERETLTDSDLDKIILRYKKKTVAI